MKILKGVAISLLVLVILILNMPATIAVYTLTSTLSSAPTPILAFSWVSLSVAVLLSWLLFRKSTSPWSNVIALSVFSWMLWLTALYLTSDNSLYYGNFEVIGIFLLNILLYYLIFRYRIRSQLHIKLINIVMIAIVIFAGAWHDQSKRAVNLQRQILGEMEREQERYAGNACLPPLAEMEQDWAEQTLSQMQLLAEKMTAYYPNTDFEAHYDATLRLLGNIEVVDYYVDESYDEESYQPGIKYWFVVNARPGEFSRFMDIVTTQSSIIIINNIQDRAALDNKPEQHRYEFSLLDFQYISWQEDHTRYLKDCEIDTTKLYLPPYSMEIASLNDEYQNICLSKYTNHDPKLNVRASLYLKIKSLDAQLLQKSEDIELFRKQFPNYRYHLPELQYQGCAQLD